jgi:hypothetical protein
MRFKEKLIQNCFSIGKNSLNHTFLPDMQSFHCNACTVKKYLYFKLYFDLSNT